MPRKNLSAAMEAAGTPGKDPEVRAGLLKQSDPDAMAQLNVRIPQRLKRKLAMAAVVEGRSQQDLVAEWIEGMATPGG